MVCAFDRPRSKHEHDNEHEHEDDLRRENLLTTDN
jgi:hypothetical protein